MDKRYFNPQHECKADVEIWLIGIPKLPIKFQFEARTSAAQDWLEEFCNRKGMGVVVTTLCLSTLKRTLELIELMRIDGLVVDITHLVALDIETVSKRHSSKKKAS